MYDHLRPIPLISMNTSHFYLVQRRSDTIMNRSAGRFLRIKQAQCGET